MKKVSTKIVETVPIIFFVYHLEQKEVEFISQQFYDLVTEAENDENVSLKECIHPDDQNKFIRFFTDLSAQNGYRGSIELKASDILKDIDWVEVKVFPIREKDASTVLQVVGHVVNITEKKEIYDTLEEEREHITNLLNMLVHDLRAPFTRVAMIAELLESSMTAEELSRHKPYLTMLQKQGEQSTVLIKSVLRLATLKGEASSMDLNIHDMRKLLEESISRQQVRIEEKKLKIQYHFPEENVHAKLDKVLFLQVLENLISNAIKYTPTGGTIGLWLAYENNMVQLRVSDNGIGIAEKHQKSIFKSMQGLRRPGLEGEESIGIGLFICKEIVKMHHGKIGVESKEGEGATFIVSLPVPESSSAYF